MLPSDTDDQKNIFLEYLRISLEAGERARNRAQAGYTIVSVLGAAFIGAVITTRLNGINPASKVLAIAALVIWVVAVPLYLAAATRVAKPIEPRESDLEDEYERLQLEEMAEPSTSTSEKLQTEANWTDRIERILSFVQGDRLQSMRNLTHANYAAGIFTVVATASIVIGIVASTPARHEKVSIYLASEGAEFFRSRCDIDEKTKTIHAEIEPAMLTREYVPIGNIRECGSSGTYTIPRSWIRVYTSGT
jgi:hypothetical protein